jgi:hypothetical protein
MRLRIWLALAGIVLVLAFVWVLLEYESRTGGSDEELLFAGFDGARAQSIEVSGKDEDEVVLERTAEGWRVPAEGGYPADPDGVREIIEFLAAAKAERKVSENPEKQGIFEVDEATGLAVRVSGDEGAVLASFFIGKSGPDFMSTYVRPQDSNAVYLVDESLRRLFVRPSPRQWRDKAIFRLSSVDITHMRWEREGEQVALEVDAGGNWTLTVPSSAPAVRNEVEVLRNSVATLQADDFADGASDREAGFDVPHAIVEFKLRDGVTHTFEVGGENDRSQRHVRRGDKETIFLVNNYRINSLLKGVDELKAPPPEPEGAPAEPPSS